MTVSKAAGGTEKQEFHHPDRLGTQLVTNGGTGTSFRQTTFPVGTKIAAETTGNTNQVFTSYDRSSGSGLDYAVNRTYSPGQSRFTQVDPIGMASASLGNPQSNNLYAYVQNMPTDYVDPSGLLIAVYRCEYERSRVCDENGLNCGPWENSGPRNCHWEFTNIGGGPGDWIDYANVSFGGGGTGPGGVTGCAPGTPPTDDKKKKEYEKCMKNERRECYKQGRAYFDDNFYTAILLGTAAGVATRGAHAAREGAGVWGAFKNSVGQVVRKAGPYVTVVTSTLAVRALAKAAKTIEDTCMGDKDELCRRRSGLL
ncbi:MAG: RHS repeat-associated core domain-containing protein [Pyrinomonadaceae bacterium]